MWNKQFDTNLIPVQYSYYYYCTEYRDSTRLTRLPGLYQGFMKSVLCTYLLYSSTYILTCLYLLDFHMTHERRSWQQGQEASLASTVLDVYCTMYRTIARSSMTMMAIWHIVRIHKSQITENDKTKRTNKNTVLYFDDYIQYGWDWCCYSLCCCCCCC